MKFFSLRNCLLLVCLRLHCRLMMLQIYLVSLKLLLVHAAQRRRYKMALLGESFFSIQFKTLCPMHVNKHALRISPANTFYIILMLKPCYFNSHSLIAPLVAEVERDTPCLYLTDHHDHVCAPSVIGMLSQCT